MQLAPPLCCTSACLLLAAVPSQKGSELDVAEAFAHRVGLPTDYSVHASLGSQGVLHETQPS